MSYRGQLLTDGWFVVRGVLSPEDIEVALARLAQIAAAPTYYTEVLGKHGCQMRPVGDEALQQHADPLRRFDWIDGITFFDPVLWERVAANPRLVEVACGVLGDDVFPTNGGGFFLKPSGSGKGIPWHQDASPFREDPVDGKTVNPLLFDFWLGLSAATAEMGCLRLIPGSQHKGRLPHEDTGGMLPALDPFVHGYTEDDIVTVETGPGDLIVWHQDMIHGSEPNQSGKSRIAVATVYHGRAEEEKLRQEHRKGAIRRRPQIAANGRPCALEDAVELPAEVA